MVAEVKSKRDDRRAVLEIADQLRILRPLSVVMFVTGLLLLGAAIVLRWTT